MTNKPGNKNETGSDDFSREIGAKAQRKVKAKRRNSHDIWFGLGMMGLIGWSVVIPTLGGAALGIWIDTHHPGPHSWTLMLLAAGVVVGCLSAWHWVDEEHRKINDDTDEQGDNDE
ncbi:MAG: AtpZ/AtpI family protein [Armatimonadota bacterium]